MSALAHLLVALLGAAEPQTFEDCEDKVRREPAVLASYECLADLPRRNNQWVEAVRRLEAILEREPTNHLARLALGALEASRAQDRAEQLFLDAADGLAAQGRRVESVRARLNLSVFLQIRGRDDDSEAQLALAAAMAETVGDKILQARVWNVQGRQASRRGDYTRSWQLFKRSEAAIFPDGPPAMQAFCLSMLGFLSGQMGRREDAIRYYRREIELLQRAGDRWSEARARLNLAGQARRRWERGEIEREPAMAAAREALAAAAAVNARDVVGWAHAHLGRLSSGAEALEHYQRALEASREVKDANGIGEGLRGLAWTVAGAGERTRADQLLEEALALARHDSDGEEIGAVLAVRAAVRYRNGEREGALRDGLAVLDEVEGVRDRAGDDLVRARIFSQWAFAYHRVVATLLDAGAPAREDVARAFSVMERMRARVLLEALDLARATARLGRSGPAAERRAAALRAIAAVQRRLQDPALAGEERDRAQAELERRELDEVAAREELAHADPAFAALRRPRFPSLDELEKTLSSDEAFLSFLVAEREDPDGSGLPSAWKAGSWLLCHTRAGTRAYRLPPGRELARAVSFYLGLLSRRDGSDADAAAVLHRMLLSPALADLPPAVTRLTIAPDGTLNRVPFHALRSSAAEPPLAWRYRIAVTPSATIWLRLRRGPRPAGGPALVLADPELPAGGDPLGPLPHARAEARLVARALGEGARVLVGAEASETGLKRARIDGFGLVHFATHAVVDDTQPERSALMLAAGAPDEDGLLQIREIVDLDFQDRIVVLSACRSASGEVLAGEGVLGLARAFFQAGARTVVGSLWPLRDDEARDLFAGLYERLGEGRSVAEALAEARAARIRAGAPPAAWAGVVALGDVDVRPVPSGSPGRGWTVWLAVGAAVVALIAAAGLLLARRARAPGRS